MWKKRLLSFFLDEKGIKIESKLINQKIKNKYLKTNKNFLIMFFSVNLSLYYLIQTIFII